jgi:hypothetical protein
MREVSLIATALCIVIVELFLMAGARFDLGPAAGVAFWNVTFALVIAYIADARGRSGFGWLFYGSVASLIALIHLLCLPPIYSVVEARAVESGEKKRCPDCAELVRPQAKKCRYCGYVFPNLNTPGFPVSTSQLDRPEPAKIFAQLPES